MNATIASPNYSNCNMEIAQTRLVHPLWADLHPSTSLCPHYKVPPIPPSDILTTATAPIYKQVAAHII